MPRLTRLGTLASARIPTSVQGREPIEGEGVDWLLHARFNGGSINVEVVQQDDDGLYTIDTMFTLSREEALILAKAIHDEVSSNA